MIFLIHFAKKTERFFLMSSKKESSMQQRGIRFSSFFKWASGEQTIKNNIKHTSSDYG